MVPAACVSIRGHGDVGKMPPRRIGDQSLQDEGPPGWSFGQLPCADRVRPLDGARVVSVEDGAVSMPAVGPGRPAPNAAQVVNA